MNKRKFFLGAGASVLAIGAFFAGKANGKFTNTSIYYTQGTSHVCTAINNAGVFTTQGSAGSAISFVTTGGGVKPVFSDFQCTSQINTGTHHVVLVK